MPERVRRTLAAGADMALVCNAPAAVDGVLDALEADGTASERPVSQARLVALRRRPPVGTDLEASGGAFRGSSAWVEAIRLLDAAQAPPDLTLG